MRPSKSPAWPTQRGITPLALSQPVAAAALLSKVIRTDAPSDADKVSMTLGFGAKSVTFQALLTSCELQMAVGTVMQASLQFQCCGEMSAVVL